MDDFLSFAFLTVKWSLHNKNCVFCWFSWRKLDLFNHLTTKKVIWRCGSKSRAAIILYLIPLSPYSISNCCQLSMQIIVENLYKSDVPPLCFSPKAPCKSMYVNICLVLNPTNPTLEKKTFRRSWNMRSCTGSWTTTIRFLISFFSKRFWFYLVIWL